MSGLNNLEELPASSPHVTASSPCTATDSCGSRHTTNPNRFRERLPDSDPVMQLLQAYEQNNLQLFRNLLREMDPYGFTVTDPNHMYGSPWNATCLEMACGGTDRSGFVRALLQSGSDPNQINPFNNRRAPIHLVAEKSSVDSMKFLLDHNSIDINLQDGSQNSALHLLAKQKTDSALECFILLLDNMDINVNQKDSAGNTAMDIAINHGSKEVVQAMLDMCGKRLNLDTPHRLDRQTTRTVLMDKFKDIKKIPDAEQVKTSVMEFKQILFSHLHKQECDVFIAELERNGVNIFEVINKNDGLNTYLQYATKYNLHNVVRRLLQFNADPNVVTAADKRPPLVIACIQREYVTVDLLLTLGAAVNIDAADGKGNTALHWAARNRDLKMIVKLIDHGADYRVRNNFDEPPLSASVLHDVLDRCLRCNGSFPDTEDYEMLFDYSVLVAHEGLKTNRFNSDEELCSIKLIPVPEMELLHRMSRLHNSAGIFKHPIVNSFLNIKWQRFKHLFYTNLLFDLLFVILLGHHLTSQSFSLLQNICMTTFAILLVMKEISKLCSSSLKEYARDYENPLNLVLLTVGCVSVCRREIPYDLTPVLVSGVFLAAFKAVLIIGRVPQLSKYNEMLRMIFLDSYALLSCLSVLLLAFGYGFYALFRDGSYYPEVRRRSVFASPEHSLYQTVLMMAGGIFSEDFPTRFYTEMPYGTEVRHSYVIIFVFTVSIVLVNTLVGLAVHTTLAVQSKADELSIKSKIKNLHGIEKLIIFLHRLLDNCCSTKKPLKIAYNILKPIARWLEKCIIFSRVLTSEKIIRIAPNKHNLVILPENVICGGSFKIDNRVVGEAMKVISHRNQNEITTLKK